MKVVKWITGDSRGRGKSLIPSTIITLAIVAMLILSGPAQAVAVLILGEDSYTKDKDIEFQVKIDLNENDKYIPLTNISLDLTGTVSQRAVFDLNGEKISSNSNCNIEMTPVSVPNSNDFGYGSGYGYDTRTGYGYNFGNGYGYGYGYGGGGGKISYIYNVSIESDCLSAGQYTVVATLNTDQNIAFHSSPFNFELTSGNVLSADVEIKPETLNLASKGTITAFISSEDFNVKDIIGSTVTITCDGCNTVHAVKWNKADKKFIAKFKTQDLQNVDTGDSVEFIITGKINNDMFEGSDTIRVIEKGKKSEDDDDDCECDDDDEDENDDEHEHEDECDDDHAGHDDDKVNDHKPEKNKNNDKKNSNNHNVKGKYVVINDIEISGNTAPVTLTIYNEGNGNKNGNKGGKNKK